VDGVVDGDSDRDGILDPGEVWLFTSAGVDYVALPGAYRNVVTATGRVLGLPDHLVVASDANHHVGTATGLVVAKAVNAADPWAPTAAEDADTAAEAVILAQGTTVTWTYLVTTTSPTPLAVTLVDDNGTPTDPG